MLTLDHKPWEHQSGTFPREHKPWRVSSPSLIVHHQLGAPGSPCRGGFPGPGEKPAQDAGSSPPGALSRRGQGWGEPGQACCSVEPDSTNKHVGCDDQKLNNTKYVFCFPCWFCCSEKEKKRIDFFFLFPFPENKENKENSEQ